MFTKRILWPSFIKRNVLFSFTMYRWFEHICNKHKSSIFSWFFDLRMQTNAFLYDKALNNTLSNSMRNWWVLSYTLISVFLKQLKSVLRLLGLEVVGCTKVAHVAIGHIFYCPDSVYSHLACALIFCVLCALRMSTRFDLHFHNISSRIQMDIHSYKANEKLNVHEF